MPSEHLTSTIRFRVGICRRRNSSWRGDAARGYSRGSPTTWDNRANAR